MTTPSTSHEENLRFGLCAGCLHARFIESSKGSRFLLCQLSQSDPNFPKYPPVPVLSCRGYSPKPAS
jgi:hypothetical protein